MPAAFRYMALYGPTRTNVSVPKASPLNACADLRIPGGAERTFEAQILNGLCPPFHLFCRLPIAALLFRSGGFCFLLADLLACFGRALLPLVSVCLCNSAVHATNHDAPQDLTVQDAAMFSCSHVRYCFQVFSFFECLSFSANFLSCKQLSSMCRGHLRRGRVRCQRRHLSIACDISSGRRTDVPAKRWAPVPARLANLTWSSQRQVFRFCRFAAVLHT